jgi:hypothetical protein
VAGGCSGSQLVEQPTPSVAGVPIRPSPARPKPNTPPHPTNHPHTWALSNIRCKGGVKNEAISIWVNAVIETPSPGPGKAAERRRRWSMDGTVRGAFDSHRPWSPPDTSLARTLHPGPGESPAAAARTGGGGPDRGGGFGG